MKMKRALRPLHISVLLLFFYLTLCYIHPVQDFSPACSLCFLLKPEVKHSAQDLNFINFIFHICHVAIHVGPRPKCGRQSCQANNMKTYKLSTVNVQFIFTTNFNYSSTHWCSASFPCQQESWHLPFTSMSAPRGQPGDLQQTATVC